MKNEFFTILIVLIICSLTPAFSACTETMEPISSEDEEESTTVETIEEEDTLDPETFSTKNIVIDGSINSHEYLYSLKDEGTGIEVHWLNDDQYIHIGIIANSSGWTAIGFNPEFAMKGANIIFMAIDDQDIIMRDDFGNSNFSHSSDMDLGGSFDIEEYAGKSDGNKAVYEFKMLLDTGDEFDGILNPGVQYKVIFAVNSRGIDFNSKHTKKSSSQIQLN